MPSRLVDKRISQRKIGSAPKKVLVSAIGGQVFISGSYKVHVFTSTDSFQVLYKATGSNLTWQYILFAGGTVGANGQDGNVGLDPQQGGAGGTGGSGGKYTSSLNSNMSLFDIRTSYTITVGGAGSNSTIATNSTTITTATGLTPGGGGSAGVGEKLYGAPDCPNVESEGTAGGDGGAPIISSIIFGGPYISHGAGGGGGGGAGGNNGGQSGRTGTAGDGGYGADANTYPSNATAGQNGAVNSGDGGGGGGGGPAFCVATASYLGAAGGTGGSGIVYIKYQFEE